MAGQLFYFEIRLSHLEPQRFGFVGARDNAPVVVT